MKFSFLYGKKNLEFELDEANILYHAELGDLPPVSNIKDELVRSLRKPIGIGELTDMVDESMQVVIVADDLTRGTPQKELLPPLLDFLNSAGVQDSNVTVVIALGTHRPMTDEEILTRFGQEVVSRVKIINHDFKDPDKRVSLGKTPLGTEVGVNKLVYEADLRILVGTVMPHPLAGWGGGAKMIQPGVCSEETTESTHFIGGTYPFPLELPGNPDNPVRKEIEQVASAIGPTFIVNTVLNHEGELVACFSGDYIAAHRAAVEVAENLFRPLIPDLADVVICNAFPCDLDFWQGFKPFYYAHLGVKEGGTIIYVISAPEGVSGDAPEHTDTVLGWSIIDPDITLEALDQNKITNRIAGSVCVSHSRLLQHADVICISDGMTDSEINQLGFTPVDSIDQAIQMALEKHGNNAKFGVMPYGGLTLVKVEN